MKTEFKKLAKIIENLRKVDGSITEDNILRKVEFDCDFTDIDKLKKIYDKVQMKNDEMFYEKLEKLGKWVDQNGRKPKNNSKN